MQEEIQSKDKDFAKFYHCFIDENIWAHLSFKAKAVYPVLLRYADYYNRTSFPGLTKIEEKSGVKEESVREAIKELRLKGLIKKTKIKTEEGYLRNVYLLYRNPNIGEMIACVSRKKTVKCRTKRNPKTGKFMKNTVKNDVILPKKTEDVSREKHGIKENLEIYNKNLSGSALACPKSQASPEKSVEQKERWLDYPSMLEEFERRENEKDNTGKSDKRKMS